MIAINEINNTSIILKSIDKAYNQAKIDGKLKVSNIYILNLLYNYLNDCCSTLDNTTRKILIDKYRKIYFNSKEICNLPFIEKYELGYKTKFEQADTIDCNTSDNFPKIFYWQESDYTITSGDIQVLLDDTNYLNLKQFDTYSIFANKKEIIYTEVGRISFALTNTLSTDNYKIFDDLGNDITHTFTKVYNDIINTTLFTSNNIYSHGNIKITIKK